MGCEITRDAAGNLTTIVCSRGRRRAYCEEPGCRRDSERLCDYPLRGEKAGKTCDRKLCGGHARRVGPDRDYCPAHAAEVRTAAGNP